MTESRSASPDATLLRSARTVSSLTLLSRVLGLLRDAATAALLGNTWINDALNWAWTFPNAFRRLFGEGALSAAFVPVVSRSLQRDGLQRAREVSNGLVSSLAVLLVTLSAALVGAVALLPVDVFGALIGESDPVRAAGVARLLCIVLPYLAGVCITAQLMAALHVAGEFRVPAFAQVIVNLTWLAGVGVALLVTDDAFRRAEVIAWSVIVSAVLQIWWHLPALRRVGLAFRFVRPRATAELRSVVGLMGPMLVGMGAGQLAVLADSHIALMLLPEGGRTHIYYGMRLMQFPLGLVAVALATVAYPLLSRLAERDDRAGMQHAAGLALRTDLALTLPAAAGLLLLAHPIAGLLFERGEFGPDATAATAAALSGYAWGLPFAGSVLLLTRASWALGNTALPVRVGLATLAVNVTLDLLLVGPLAEFGLGLATSLSAAFACVLLYFGVRARLGGGALRGASPWRLALATLAMAAVVWGLDRGLVALAENVLALPAGADGALFRALRVSFGLVAGAAVYAFCLARLCPQEWSAVTQLLPRRRER